MIRRPNLFVLTLIVLTGPLVLVAQKDNNGLDPVVMQAVEAAFPKELRSTGVPLSGERSPTNPDTCASVFSMKADGTPDLVIASYSGKGVEVAMLAYQQGEAHNIDAVTDRQFYFDGDYCDISIINLADHADASSLLARTIQVSFGEGPNWFFIWDGMKLRNITALKYEWGPKDVPNTAIYGALIVDIDHSGPMQIVATSEEGDNFPDVDGIAATGKLTLFRYNGTSYAPAKTLQYLRQYEPNLPKTPEEQAEYKSDDWAHWTQSINMHQTPAPSYKLKIVNGDRDGSNRVSSAKVEINGATIVLPTEINQTVENLVRNIQLKKQNKIKVTVDGPAKSHLYVIVE